MRGREDQRRRAAVKSSTTTPQSPDYRLRGGWEECHSPVTDLELDPPPDRLHAEQGVGQHQADGDGEVLHVVHEDKRQYGNPDPQESPAAATGSEGGLAGEVVVVTLLLAEQSMSSITIAPHSPKALNASLSAHAARQRPYRSPRGTFLKPSIVHRRWALIGPAAIPLPTLPPIPPT